MNDGSTYLTIQTQPNTGATELSGAKILNTPIIIQSSPSIPIQTSQYQQQSTSTINVQPNTNTVTSLTPSQLQSLSYLMQTQITPQLIQTSNGLIQIIPHGLITTQTQNNQMQNHNQDQLLSSQITTLPTLGWSLNNFNTANNQISIDNQVNLVFHASLINLGTSLIWEIYSNLIHISFDEFSVTGHRIMSRCALVFVILRWQICICILGDIEQFTLC